MRYFREELLKQTSIKGVITLKTRFFRRATIPTAIIVLGKVDEETWFTSAVSIEDLLSILSNIKDYPRRVFYSKYIDSENLMPEHYNDELKKIKDKLESYNTKRLEDIADIILGKSVKKEELSAEGIPYIRARNLQEEGIKNIDTFVKVEAAEKYAKQLLQEGDILLSKNFGEHRIVQVGINDIPAIASNGMFIIRAFGVPESYLFEYFSSKTGKKIFNKQLASIETGTTIISINLRDLKELMVPIFDKQTMYQMSHVENIESDELISITKTLVSHMAVVSARELELQVFKSFIDAGWGRDDLKENNKSFSICLHSDIHWMPDIVLLNQKKVLAVVEIKNDFTKTSRRWINNMYEVIQSGQVPFLILTTGQYYEVHSRGNSTVKKFITAPTKEELLALVMEKEDE